ncbi:polysaccharide biosynthesis C-terminal domain-containing protein [Bacteroidales bacterium OttesenSCG-928-K03]|nr:polysaccharide biosynthesis C-terminal domain-containing protein [Odoribacter sp. OttesenSCG-928-L07]MDL2239496.1 polysaccharide biosynthesis C-terminal domain-containing protein [Bacteroidales bacterium OttesenSCG-928-L14]MDL2242964.1 polysaccharide biosynthesis C-terminal domain-containing protein [Bacteroidales bacterium OttesenSCG-928-K03]
MSAINLKKNIIETIFVKGGILILNFAITFVVARLWGAEGKGMVALFVADLGMISIFCNIFTTSSVSYYLKKIGQSKLATQAYIWVFVASAILALILSFVGGSKLSLLLFVISVLLGFVVFHSSLFIGDQKIPYYNLITLLQPLLLLVFMLLFYFVFKDKFGYHVYFYSQIISLTLIFVVAKILTNKVLGKAKFDFDKEAIKNSFNFGWKTELSNLLQFWNYRFSMYAIPFLCGADGIKMVGVFAMGISISEAIWMFSKSISVVQYSNVLATGDTLASRKETAKVSYISLFASLACVVIIAILPAKIFPFIFGADFEYVKTVILLLSPGILAISISNVYGNFFSAIGKLNILIIKSAAGLIATIILSLFLIPKLGIAGASIVNSCAYIVSSVILIVYFFRGK